MIIKKLSKGKNKSDRISCLHNLVFSEFTNQIIISSLEAIVTNTINFETLKKGKFN